MHHNNININYYKTVKFYYNSIIQPILIKCYFCFFQGKTDLKLFGIMGNTSMGT